MPDIFNQLLSASWKGVEFPVSRMRATIAHDLVEHKRWGVDGARVEDTGLAPWRYTFSVPLIAGLTPGKAERWKKLYPTQMRLLVAKFQERKSGMLQHPEFGLLLCKADKGDFDWEATRRGGVDLEISFVETNPEVDQEVREPSPVSEMSVAVGTLDSPTVKRDLEQIFADRGIDLPPYLKKDSPFSFTEAMQKIKAIVDYPSLLDRQFSGKIDAIVYHAEALQRSIAPAKTPKTWPAVAAIEQIKSNSFRMSELIIAAKRKVGTFTLPDHTTLSGAARLIPGATISDLVKLNPKEVVKPVLVAGTVLRYYLPEGQKAAA